jgi:hypothetical protein
MEFSLADGHFFTPAAHEVRNLAPPSRNRHSDLACFLQLVQFWCI